MANIKGYKSTAKELKKVSLFIESQILEKNILSVPIDLRKFLNEIDALLDDVEKNYSPERSIKLRGIIVAFLSINNIEKNKDIQSLLDGFNSIKTLGSAALFFSGAYDKIYTILERYPYRTFMQAKLYFIDKSARDEIVKIELELLGVLENKNEKQKLKFNKIIKLLNPQEISGRYSVHYKSKYQYISKQDSIEKYLPTHYKITLNKVQKDFNDLFDTHTFSPVKKKQIQAQRESELQRIKDEYEYLIKAFKNDEIDIKILSYEHSSLYPEVKYSVESVDKKRKQSKTKYAFLRSEVPNVLWYESSQTKKSDTVSSVISHYNYAFGDVYYI